MRIASPVLCTTLLVSLAAGLAVDVDAQGRGRKRELVKQFDKNTDGWLNSGERAVARKWLAENPVGSRRGGPGRGRGPAGRGGFGSRRGSGPESASMKAKKQLTPKSVARFPKAKLYDTSVLRTIFLEFEEGNFDDELTAFHRTDVCVPAKMTVDGTVFKTKVGVRYRGNTSFSSVPKGQKKSINIHTDFIDSKQRFYGYKTLNLLNCHTDASFLREVVFSKICREYMAATKANFVRVVINGENWGIYSNIQQVNKDFLRDNFGTKKGVRYKVAPDFSGAGGLMFLGENLADYQRSYDLKTEKADKDCWKRLVRICDLLDFAGDKALEDFLPSVLDIDHTLWFLALDNVFLDGDGYHSRASDYNLYEDPRHRFHLFFHDNNEVMRSGGGRGGGRGPGGRGGPGGGRGVTMSPLVGVGREDRPLLNRMLAIPAWRARYLAHVRTITLEWLDWAKIGPVFHKFHDMIDADVELDRKRLYTYAQFTNSVEARSSATTGPTDTPRGGRRGGFGSSGALRDFIEQRSRALLADESLKGPWPTIVSVEPKPVRGETAGMSHLHVLATVGKDVAVEKVLLYARDKKLDTFKVVPMLDDGQHGDGEAGDGVYGGTTTEAFRAGKKVRYYVEARTKKEIGTTVFHPSKAAGNAHIVRFVKK